MKEEKRNRKEKKKGTEMEKKKDEKEEEARVETRLIQELSTYTYTHLDKYENILITKQYLNKNLTENCS